MLHLSKIMNNFGNLIWCFFLFPGLGDGQIPGQIISESFGGLHGFWISSLFFYILDTSTARVSTTVLKKVIQNLEVHLHINSHARSIHSTWKSILMGPM